MKPTAFVSNDVRLVQNLRQECNGRHVWHAPLAGTLFGMSKTWYAQQWPPKLCKAIVDAIEKVCFQPQAPMSNQAYAGEAAPKPVCPGCKAHAYRGDPRHTRERGICKFPDDSSDNLTCPACLRNLPSHHPLHTKVPGECHWASALPRVGGSRGGSALNRPQMFHQTSL